VTPRLESKEESNMPARRKASKKKAAAKRKPAPRRKVAARKAVARKAAPKKRAARKPAAPRKPAMPASPPSAIGMMSHHLDYTTHDLGAVRRFYTEVLGFSKFNHDPNMNYLYVETGTSSSVGFMPPMEDMGTPSPAKEPTLYFIVEDVDGVYASLSAKGVMFEGPPADMPWGHRVIRTADPEGRVVMLATLKK
jgi:predicted enzyme related to lactoylglutathione lyase